jgi:exopolyphosphatase/pppGpp-phosphohydrolase
MTQSTIDKINSEVPALLWGIRMHTIGLDYHYEYWHEHGSIMMRNIGRNADGKIMTIGKIINNVFLPVEA